MVGPPVDRRAQVEEVGVAAADALVLEVAVDDRELEAAPPCRPSMQASASGASARAGEARLELALIVAAVALRRGCRRRTPRPSRCCRCRSSWRTPASSAPSRQFGSLMQVFEHPVPSPKNRPLGPVQARVAVGRRAAVAGLVTFLHTVAAHRRDALAGLGVLLQVAPGSTAHVGSSRRPPSCCRRRTLRRRSPCRRRTRERTCGRERGTRSRFRPSCSQPSSHRRAVVLPSSHASDAPRMPSPQTPAMLQTLGEPVQRPARGNLADGAATIARRLVAVVARLALIHHAVAALADDRRLRSSGCRASPPSK